MLILAATQRAEAQQGNSVEPYILFIVDVSGSMESATGHGSPSCITGDTRLNHAKCAVQDIVNGFGDMVMALGRYRQRPTSSATCPVETCNGGFACSSCDADVPNDPTCTPQMSSGDRFELLVPLVEQNQNELLEWVDGTCGVCTVDQSAQPELYPRGATPIAGSIKGAQRYFQGLNTPGIDTNVGVQSYVPPFWGGQGADPIRNDPLKDVFISPGQQCRPYVVILLTDGSETCAHFDTVTVPAVQALLATDVDGVDYRIDVRPIGLGQSPGDVEIEAIAHAGGAVDGPGNEGFYAQNQEELALAFAQIISDALRFEVCNDLDDDCDLAIDEDFPAKGTQCDDGALGICKATGVRQCTADGTGVECIITTPGQSAKTEACNLLDDDCDGKVDEGGVCPNGCSGEICDGLDNDCDTLIDEDVTRSCGTDVGVCVSGTETCVNGTFQNCTATGGSQETCNGLDDDCDGIVDGITETCTLIPGNNPGVGQCQSGIRVCPSTGSGVFGPCVGEVGPVAEQCDTLDNDCDGKVDEDAGGDVCNGTCGVGVTECVDGTLVCSADFDPSDEVCDSLDNDCDGTIDEEVPDAGDCNDGSLCEPGTLMCIGGAFECIGGVEPVNEICDCEDNNCNGTIDEGGSTLCAPGADCVECQCAFPCEEGEFPCPLGKFCSEDNFCLNDPCFGIECLPNQDGEQTVCVDGACVRACDVVECPGGLVCQPSNGACVPDDCISFPDKCGADQVCAERECVDNPCSGVECPADQYCSLGECFGSCAEVVCAIGETCVLGQCEADRCSSVQCGQREFCNPDTGVCEDDPCADMTCGAGQVCNSESARCETDACLGVVCPTRDEICDEGSCYSPDGPHRQIVSPGGAGCSAGGATGTAFALLFALLALAGVRRRRNENV